MLISEKVCTMPDEVIQNDLTPFGFIEDGSEPEAEVIDGDYWMWARREKRFL